MCKNRRMTAFVSPQLLKARDILMALERQETAERRLVDAFASLTQTQREDLRALSVVAVEAQRALEAGPMTEEALRHAERCIIRLGLSVGPIVPDDFFEVVAAADHHDELELMSKRLSPLGVELASTAWRFMWDLAAQLIRQPRPVLEAAPSEVVGLEHPAVSLFTSNLTRLAMCVGLLTNQEAQLEPHRAEELASLAYGAACVLRDLLALQGTGYRVELRHTLSPAQRARLALRSLGSDPSFSSDLAKNRSALNASR